MDERLRQHQRLGDAGDLEAQAKALQARLRRGEHEQVRLLAYLELPAAREVLGHSAPPAPAELAAWVHGLSQWGKEPCVRAARAAVELVRAECLRKQPQGADVGELLARIEGWLVAPGDEQADLVHAATLDLQRALQRRLFLNRGLHAFVLAGKTSWMSGIYAKQAASCAARVASQRNEPAVRSAIRDALVSWTLR